LLHAPVSIEPCRAGQKTLSREGKRPPSSMVRWTRTRSVTSGIALGTRKAHAMKAARQSQTRGLMSAAAVDKSRFVVLVALDDSKAVQEVLRVAANFARMTPGGELHLVYVIEDMPPPTALVPRPSGLGITAGEIVATARRRLDELAAAARAQFEGRLVTHVAAGSAWKQILQLAIDVQADLILVGTHGRTGIKRMLLGSVAESVVRKASCPVIVVREKDYHAFVPPEIEPACAECVQTQRLTNGANLWCERHSQHHPHAHVHYEVPEAFGQGSHLFHS
jgi:nucleotide-binding universal stress UspA family protein